jgi:REP element-mobilizing transposase RayT
MPTHYHFLIRVKDINSSPHIQTSGVLKTPDVATKTSKAISILQMSYAKAFNKMHSRHGSLFQARFQAKPIKDESYLITLLTYIHQNPTRSHLVEKAEEWEFSSCQDYLDLRKGTLPNKNLLLSTHNKMQIKEITDIPIRTIDTKYWF